MAESPTQMSPERSMGPHGELRSFGESIDSWPVSDGRLGQLSLGQLGHVAPASSPQVTRTVEGHTTGPLPLPAIGDSDGDRGLRVARPGQRRPAVLEQVPSLATHRLPAVSKPTPYGWDKFPWGPPEMVTVGAGEAVASSALLYSTTVPAAGARLATHRLPAASKARATGPLTPAVMTASGRALPVAPGR